MDQKQKIEHEKLKKQLALIKETITQKSYNLGSGFFVDVVQNLNVALSADYTFIGQLNEKHDEITTIALCSEGKILDNFSYKLQGTPCENVVGQHVCSYPDQVTKLFPEDELLIDMQVKAYVGVPLFDSAANASGIIVSLFKTALDDTETAESILLIFASRAAAELEHRKNNSELHKIYTELALKSEEYRALNEKYLAINEKLKLKNEELALSEEKFKMLFEQSGTANAFFNLDGILEYQNSISANYLLGNTKDFIGRSISDLFGKEQGAVMFERFKEVKQSKKTEVFETLIELPAGNKWFRTIYQPVLNSNKQIEGIQMISREITREKEAELKLVESQKKYSNVVETATDLITIVDKNGILLFVNHAAEKIFGIKPEACIGLNAFEFVHPEDRAKTTKEFHEWVKSTEVNFSFENRQVHKNGSTHYMLWSIYVNREKNGAIIDITSIARDITERKRIENELIIAKNIAEQNEVRLKIAQEASKAGAWEWDMVKNTFYWPDELIKLFGFNPEDEFNFETWRKAIHPEDVEMADKYLDIAIETKTDLVSDFRIVKRDGEISWIRTFGRVFYDADKPIRMVGMCLDITDQKLNAEALLENEEKFRTTIQNIPGMVYRAKADWTVELMVNSELVCGYNSIDFINEKIKWVELIYDEDWQRVYQEGEKIRAEKGNLVQEYRIKAKDGTIRYVKDYKTSRFEGGTFIGVDGIVFDNTVSKQLEEELKLAKDKAEESDRLKSAFLANMSHEIRTPMNGILGFSDLLTRSDLSQGKRQYYATIIQSSTQQLLNIISDIIDISKIEAEEFTLDETTFSMQDFCKEILAQTSILLKQKNKTHIELFTENEDGVTHLTTDRNRLSQVILNLITNAVKFTEAGYIKLVCERLDDSLIRFSVKDTGIGIEQTMHEVIFQRFRQVKDKSFEGGTGLGLAICKAIVEKMGGELSVESEFGKGSNFIFTIKQGIEANKKIHNHDKAVNGLKDSKAKILIAEDEDINYLYLFELLNSERFELIRAENGKIAIELFRKHKPDLVLMDIKMPVMNGFEALEELQKLDERIPVLAVTAYAMAGDEKKALEAGFKCYLSKPVSKERLWAAINEYL